jgi:hypothetical protein
MSEADTAAPLDEAIPRPPTEDEPPYDDGMPMQPDGRERLVSRQMDLALVRREGEHLGIRARWLRFETLDGRLLTTGSESAAAAQAELKRETRRADAATERAERLAARLRALGEEPEG